MKIFKFIRRQMMPLVVLCCFVCLGMLFADPARAQAPGQNINMVSGITWPDGDPWLQRQNEPSIAVSTRNPCHLLAGANDYRTVDLNFFLTGETGDAWLGLFKSFDCGASWQSTLLPGYPLDKTPEGNPAPPAPPNPLKKWNAASDPIVRSGPNGFFGYSGIAFNRGTNNGVVFFSRFVDLNNKENGTAATGAVNSNADPIRYVGTSVIATGSTRRFLDKPWMAIDIERGGRGCTLQVPQAPPNGIVTQSVAVGNIYIAFTAFNYNQAGILTSSQILFSRSTDCGATWSDPVNLTATDDLFDTDQDSLNQGPTIAIDPETGFVYVAWRRFHTNEHSDAIVAAASISGGQWFTPGVPVITLPPFDPSHPPTGPNGPFSFFDQITTGTRMRTNAYPSLTVADSGSHGIPGQIYLAWSQRGVGPNGEARIMMVASPTTLTWPKPFPIDNGPLSDDSGNTFTRGHQFMPQLTFSGGKLVAVFYDQRIDHTLGFYAPNVPFQPDPSHDGKLYQEDRVPQGELPLNSGAVFTPFFDDKGLTQRRHTIEMMLTQAVPGPVPVFTPPVRVSQYIFGLRGDVSNPSQLQQLQEDPPNLPLFANGSEPFFGDYIDVAGLMMVPTPSGGWVFNTAANPNQAPVFYTVWTSNQDVRPPLDGNWKNYTPVGAGGPSVFDTMKTKPNCVPGQEGMRNQNVYISQITQGLLVSSPQTFKPLSTTLQRTFVVLVQNLTNFDKTFHMTIANQPPGGFASFIAGTNIPGNPGSVTPPSPVITGLDVDIPPHSGIARPVFAISSSVIARITINVVETTPPPGINSGLTGFVVFNPDPSSPLNLINPDGVNSGDISTVEIYSPSLTDPTLYNPNAPNPNAPNPNGPNTGLSNPNAPNPNAPNPNAPNPNAPNPNAPNPNAPNPDLPNPNAPNPNAPNSVVANPNAPNPNAPNPNAPNPNAPNTDITNTSIFDSVYTVKNSAGNTAASFRVKLVGDNPGNIPLQLAVNKTYQTPTSSTYETPTGAMSCQLTTENHNNVQAFINNPPIVSPVNLNDPGIQDPSSGNATFALLPGETAELVLRGYFASYTDSTAAFTAFKSLIAKVVPVVIQHAASTNDPTNTRSVTVPGGVFILTSVLPDGVVGSPYSVTLQSLGGVQPLQWSVDDPGDLPFGFSIGQNTGTLSFSPPVEGGPTAGTYSFTVRVTDAAAHTNTKMLTLRLANPLVVTTPSPLPTAVQGTSYMPPSFTATGGIGAYSWTPVANIDGLGFTSGVLSGTPTITGTFSFTAQVTDSASPAQIAMKVMTLNVVPATPAPPTGLSTLLFDNFNAAGVVQNPNGPTNPTTFVLTSTSEITQLATYHYNGGNGASPGMISLISGDRTFGPFQAMGVAGQGGPNEAWVASPNVIVPAGTYTVVDSDPSTWSYNGTSFNSAGLLNCGFTRVWGFAVQVAALSFVTQPTGTVANQTISPAVQVKATDSSGALLPFIAITISIGSNPSGGTLSGTLTQTTGATGIATFSNLSIDKAGSGYTLLASSTPSGTATSMPFSILAAAPSAGSRYLIVADGRSSPSSIFRIAPDGSSTALVATLATGRAIAVSIDQTTNTLYFADPFHAEVWTVSLWGGAVLPLFAGSPLASPVAVAVDSVGNVYVGDNSTDAVYKIIPASAPVLFANLPASPRNLQDIRMAFDALGNLIVGSDFVGDVANVSEIDLISPAGVSTTVYNSATMNGGTAIKEIGGLAIDVSGNIVVADYASSSIVKIANPGTSTMTATTLITDASLGGSTAITGLTVVDSAAGIYDVTANFANKILSVNTSTNTITTLVSGAPLTYPTDIAMSGFIPTPQPATNVTAVVKSSIPPSVTLNWAASTSAVTGYNVYRKRNGGAFTKIASVPASATSYTDTGVAFGDTLDYYVTSVDSSNVESVPSNVVHTGLA